MAGVLLLAASGGCAYAAWLSHTDDKPIGWAIGAMVAFLSSCTCFQWSVNVLSVDGVTKQ